MPEVIYEKACVNYQNRSDPCVVAPNYEDIISCPGGRPQVREVPGKIDRALESGALLCILALHLGKGHCSSIMCVTHCTLHGGVVMWEGLMERKKRRNQLYF